MYVIERQRKILQNTGVLSSFDFYIHNEDEAVPSTKVNCKSTQRIADRMPFLLMKKYNYIFLSMPFFYSKNKF